MQIPSGVEGGAYFIENNMRRLWLCRTVANASSYEHFALWVGMNPSTADSRHDDMTVRKECHFTFTKLKLNYYIKINVCSRVATNPKDLTKLDCEWRQDEIDRALELASEASVIFAATGEVPFIMQGVTKNFLFMLNLKKPMLCLGLTKNGWPKHPSRLAYDTPFEPLVGDPNLSVVP